MKNRIVTTGHFGPVYARKIHIYYRNELTGGEWRYCYSSNRYRTCREAIADAQTKHPGQTFKASFAQD